MKTALTTAWIAICVMVCCMGNEYPGQQTPGALRLSGQNGPSALVSHGR